MLRKRKNTRQQYNETNDEAKRKFNLTHQLKSKRFDQLKDTHLLELSGNELNLKLIQRNGFEKPILVEKQDGLDLLVPPKSFLVRDVRNYVGHDRIIDVMNVKTQKNIEMTMKDFCKYYESKHKDKLLNVISLEFSHTKLDEMVEAPLVVRLLDWVDLVWPKFLKQSQVESTNSITSMKYPKVQKYCLMSVKGSYTDFHIDFGGTSVWYHILRGKKIFWMVPPTELNLQIFEEWTLSGMQQDVFFGDTVEECFRVELCAGNTFFIPSGWIHAVYTLEDSLVFGGNFLHSFGMENQLKVSKIEDATKVPHKFRYPFYTEILWYVVQHYVYCLTDKDHLNRHELEAAVAREKELAEAALLEKNNNKIDSIDNETTESEHDESDNTIIEKKKPATTSKKSNKRLKPAPKKGTPAQKKKKPPPSPTSTIDDESTDIDSANEELYNDKTANKPATTTCRMTKNSLLTLQYEVEQKQKQEKENPDEDLQGSPNKSGNTSLSKASPKKKSTAPTESDINTTLSEMTTPKKSQQITSASSCAKTLNLAEIMLSQNESMLNGWSAAGAAGQAIWSNPSSESKEPPKIHLTKFEVNGLKVLVKHLSKLSGAKKNLPNLIRNSRALLDDCRKLVAEHENDDPELAITGKAITPELLRKPKTTDMNELIGQFFKQSSDTTANGEQSTTSADPSTPSSLNKCKTESGSSSAQHKYKSFFSSSHSLDFAVSNVKKEDSSSSNDHSLGTSSKLSPQKDTKSLSQNKKSTTSTSVISSPPARPISPPTRPLSNNQYTSKTAKKSNISLDLPGSFRDLIAATSSAKEAFDVKGSDVTSALYRKSKELDSPKSVITKPPEKPLPIPTLPTPSTSSSVIVHPHMNGPPKADTHHQHHHQNQQQPQVIKSKPYYSETISSLTPPQSQQAPKAQMPRLQPPRPPMPITETPRPPIPRAELSRQQLTKPEPSRPPVINRPQMPKIESPRIQAPKQRTPTIEISRPRLPTPTDLSRSQTSKTENIKNDTLKTSQSIETPKQLSSKHEPTPKPSHPNPRYELSKAQPLARPELVQQQPLPQQPPPPPPPQTHQLPKPQLPNPHLTRPQQVPRLEMPRALLSRPQLPLAQMPIARMPIAQMPIAQMPLFTTPMGAQFGLPLQQGARIVWATQPRGMQPGAPLLATTAGVSSQPKTSTQPILTSASLTKPTASFKPLHTTPTTSIPSAAPAPKNAHSQDNAALLSLATTALSTAPMMSNPTLSHLSNRAPTPQAIMVSSANQPALFALGGQPFFSPYVQRMPVTQFMTQPALAPVVPRPNTGQLVYARLLNQGQQRYLITPPGFMQPRFATAPHIVTSQPGPTLAYATYKNPATEPPKAMKTKKVKTT